MLYAVIAIIIHTLHIYAILDIIHHITFTVQNVHILQMTAQTITRATDQDVPDVLMKVIRVAQ